MIVGERKLIRHQTPGGYKKRVHGIASGLVVHEYRILLMFFTEPLSAKELFCGPVLRKESG
jgi:hypothetical protein